MPRRSALQIAAGICGTAGIALVFGPACRRALSAEDQVRSTIVAIERAIEEKNLKAVRGFLSERYQDAEEHNRQEVLALLQMLFKSHFAIHLLTRVAAIEMVDTGAVRATVVAAMASHPLTVLEDLTRVRADAYRFDLTLLRKTPDRWEVTAATWRTALPEDLFVTGTGAP